jgi:hypothetical protein
VRNRANVNDPFEGSLNTSNVGLAFSPSDAISIEIFPSFQIAIAGDSDNI